jgi:hypothetical protein
VLVSTGRVRLLALEAGAQLAGSTVGKSGLGTEPPKG